MGFTLTRVVKRGGADKWSLSYTVWLHLALTTAELATWRACKVESTLIFPGFTHTPRLFVLS